MQAVYPGGRQLVAAWLADVLPRTGEQRRGDAADIVVRLTLSHMLLPSHDRREAAKQVARAGSALLGTVADPHGADRPDHRPDHRARPVHDLPATDRPRN
ncbi:hypothetical protein ACFYPT_40715 [Streptomyces sp. NPDC005529]|uniref:hypothetical protein n=1 Tax=unclassified Streptomyces TaxID=2593676 RepID=UPI0033B5C7E6